MALLDLQDISLAFGGPPVLDRANFAIEKGERVCLLGRNGAGKSTLMRVLDGTMKADSGEIIRQTGITVARLDQEVPQDISGTTFEVVASGLGPAADLLNKYQQASHRVTLEGGSDSALRELDRAHRALDAADAWEVQSRVSTVIERLGLDPDARFESASGGRKRQTLLARALVNQPDILLLDEPTNHLDIAAIEWLEDFVVSSGTTLLFVTHDRAFLRRIATRIIELDRGKLFDWGNSYDEYIERKDAALHSESREWEEFDKKLAKEEVWIRTGIQARRTRNEGRVRALEELRRQRSARRERVGTVNLQVQEADKSGRIVFEASHLSFARGERPIVRDFSTRIGRGDRIGFIGANGSGKTTLIKLLLGELEPQSGEVKRGTNLEIAYFDQLRDQLDLEKSVFDNIADGSDYVTVNGAQKHIHSYLEDFLFSPDRVRTPVKALSGGERNRLLLAKLFTRSFNLLVLDEPTNDLDIETLDLLEDLLLNFSGTLLLVSHDREFIDNIVTGTFAFEGKGRVKEYAGGYSDWVSQRPAIAQPNTQAKNKAVLNASSSSVSSRSSGSSVSAGSSGGSGTGAVNGTEAGKSVKNPAVTPGISNKTTKKKLTLAQQYELRDLPAKIEKMEEDRTELYNKMYDPEVVRDGKLLAEYASKLEDADAKILEMMERWEELES